MVTHFDENWANEVMGGEPLNASYVKSKVAGCITDATKTEEELAIDFDEGSVIPISGQWALISKLLESRDRGDPEYKKMFQRATRALDDYPHELGYPRGQGESLEDYLKCNPDKASTLLYNASGVKALQRKYVDYCIICAAASDFYRHINYYQCYYIIVCPPKLIVNCDNIPSHNYCCTFQQCEVHFIYYDYRIEAMTKSCVKVWVRKMSSDHSTFMRNAKESLCSKQAAVKEINDGTLYYYAYA